MLDGALSGITAYLAVRFRPGFAAGAGLKQITPASNALTIRLSP
jgi:hypothetical protein